jgi:hypothetical protein
MYIYLIGYARSEQAMTNEKRKRKKDRKYENFLLNYYPACIGNSAPAKLFGTRKVVQLTGDNDRATGQKTINETGKRFGIYGTDLGVSFLHDGKLFFVWRY